MVSVQLSIWGTHADDLRSSDRIRIGPQIDKMRRREGGVGWWEVRMEGEVRITMRGF